ncbi:MAG TPA: hypothetical protein VF530_05930 [Planctomycetota bacterium]
MIAALLLALPALQAPTPHGPEPGPRAAQAGLAGFQTVSRIDFGATSNRLTAAYSFPDRARWHFESYAARARSEHQYFYRLGETVRGFDGQPSRELPAAERDAVLRQMELRRAVLFWPDGFEWQASGEQERRAPLFLDSCCHEGALGTLVAELEQGRPRRVEVHDSLGAAQEALEIRSWQELGGRTWPLTLVMSGPQGTFTETVESIETRLHLLEVSFVPPDRRPVPAAGSGPRILARDVIAMTYAAHDLPEGTSWDEALRLAAERHERAGVEAERLGLVLDPVPMFELGPDARPVRLLLRLDAPRTPPPAGHVTLPERPGLFLLLDGPAALQAQVLQHLLEAVPAGARPETPYARIHARKEARVEVVLPLGAGG